MLPIRQMSEEVRNPAAQLVDVFDLVRQKGKSEDQAANSNVSMMQNLLSQEVDYSHSHEQSQQQPVLQPDHFTLKSDDSYLGEMPPEVCSFSSAFAGEEQLDPEFIPQLIPTGHHPKIKRNKQLTYKKKQIELSREDEEQWLGEKHKRIRRNTKHKDSLGKKNTKLLKVNSRVIEKPKSEKFHLQSLFKEVSCEKNCACSSCVNEDEMLKEQKSMSGAKEDDAVETSEKGNHCSCKKSQCMKKYCYCFNLGKPCGEECKCYGCLNNGDGQ